MLAARDDVTLGRRIQASKNIEDGGLTTARMADDAGELALLHVEPQVLEYSELAKPSGVREPSGQSLNTDESIAHDGSLVCIRHQALQFGHQLVKQHPDNADEQDRRDYVGDREIVPFIPDEVANTGATHQHLRCDDDQPGDADGD